MRAGRARESERFVGKSVIVCQDALSHSQRVRSLVRDGRATRCRCQRRRGDGRRSRRRGSVCRHRNVIQFGDTPYFPLFPYKSAWAIWSANSPRPGRRPNAPHALCACPFRTVIIEDNVCSGVVLRHTCSRGTLVRLAGGADGLAGCGECVAVDVACFWRIREGCVVTHSLVSKARPFWDNCSCIRMVYATKV